MKAAPIVKTVRAGSLRVDVRSYADGRYGFDYTPPGEWRRKARYHDLKDAIERANELAGIAKAGKVERTAIDEGEYAEFLRWKAEKKKPALIPELVEAFMATKEGKGKAPRYVRSLRQDLLRFAAAFPQSISDLEGAKVEKWLNSLGVGPRRWNNVRDTIVALHRYARSQRLLPAEKTPVELIGEKQVRVVVGTYTPEEMAKILAVVQKPWLPVVVLGAFAGIRPEEVAPHNRGEKEGLRWENILWKREKIDVPAHVSKTRRRRFVPLLPAALAWLKPFRRATGPIAPQESRTCDQTPVWSRDSGVKWKHDGLRHSYASYRLALTQDLGALELELGNSRAMIFKHYLDIKFPEEAEEWFALRPPRKSSK